MLSGFKYVGWVLKGKGSLRRWEAGGGGFHHCIYV